MTSQCVLIVRSLRGFGPHQPMAFDCHANFLYTISDQSIVFSVGIIIGDRGSFAVVPNTVLVVMPRGK